MFTGLVEDLGEIVAVTAEGDGKRLTIRTALPMSEVAVGDSIAVDGACLTVETPETGAFTVVAGRETLALTTLAGARPGRPVHLERALRLGDRLGGHLVQGHVDGLGTLRRRAEERESLVLWVEVPPDLSRYMCPKGSLCVDGVSLTVNEIAGAEVRVNIVPHTARVTRLGRLQPGERVNLEVDVLAKYVERLLHSRQEPMSLETLGRWGYER